MNKFSYRPLWLIFACLPLLWPGQGPARAQPAKPAVTPASTPVTQPILTAWQEGNSAAATKLFLDAKWNATPIFAPGMAIGLNEDQFKALNDADRQIKSHELEAQWGLLRQLVTAVNAAAQLAASTGDTNLARKYFVSLKQFGSALANPARPQLVQRLGQVSRNMAEKGLAKLGP